MDLSKFRTFLDNTVFNQANILLNPRYLDMEKFRTVVLDNFNTFVSSELEISRKEHTNPILMVVSEEKEESQQVCTTPST